MEILALNMLDVDAVAGGDRAVSVPDKVRCCVFYVTTKKKTRT